MRPFAIAALAGFSVTAAFAAPKYEEMDYGRFLTASWDNTKGENTLKGKGCTANKGIAIQLGNKEGAMLFDTDLCRWAGGWVDGYITYKGVIFDGAHGPNPSPSKGANLLFQTDPGPTWSKDGNFADPRKLPTGPGAAKVPFGPLPKDWAKYKGLYVHGDQVAVNYTVGTAELLESPALEKVNGGTQLTRSFQVVKSGPGASLIVGEWPKAQFEERNGVFQVTNDPDSQHSRVFVRGTNLPPGAKLAVDGTRLVLNLPSLDAGQKFKLAFTGNASALGEAAFKAASAEAAFDKLESKDKLAGERSVAEVYRALDARKSQIQKKNEADKDAQLQKIEAARQAAQSAVRGAADESLAKAEAAIKNVGSPADLTALTKGGTRRWTQEIKTPLKPGKVGEQDSYVVDTVEVPFENPYKAWMRIGAFDFFKDGRIALGTWSGDVWIVSGLTKDFSGEAKWQRVATGLFQALGLKIVNDQIYVHGREGITRLNDLNGDGEIDFYENFNYDVQTTPGFHEFAFDLQTDSKGNFYFAKGGPVNSGGSGFQPLSDHAGTILKLTPDGQKLEIFATGVRAPNGISVGPGDVVTTGDNEGTWVPKCYVHIVKPNDFVTVASLSHRDTPPTDYGRHICFMPKDVDNSGGGQAWVVGKNWGMPEGSLLHLSYGTCSLYGVMREEIDGIPQGGVFKFPLKFESGTMRARFSPADGQLWISGLKGWQSSAAKDGSLQRVRYLGKPATFPNAINVKSNGVEIGFSGPLDAGAADAANYSVKHWNYKWTGGYGSGEHKPSDGQKGTEEVAVKSVKLSPDKTRVFLELENVQPVMQMEIKLNVKSATGAPVPARILNTINTVPAQKTANISPGRDVRK